MSFYSLLEERIALVGNPICMGLDPVLSLIPVEGRSATRRIEYFYMKILDEVLKSGNAAPAVVKPNIAYYERISIDALFTLKNIIKAYQSAGIPVILDAKRGDIGKSSAAYADTAFDIYGADAVTVSPWMGSDSVKPFIRKDSNLGAYVLLRTSNKGAEDFQDLKVKKSTKSRAAFYSVADKIVEWDENSGFFGAVVGATNPEELENITRYFVEEAYQEIPFLIPGVSIPGVPGGQGGDAKTVLQAIKNGGGKRNFHVLNSSSGLNYAWQIKENPSQFALATAQALNRLVDSLG